MYINPYLVVLFGLVVVLIGIGNLRRRKERKPDLEVVPIVKVPPPEERPRPRLVVDNDKLPWLVRRQAS